MEQNKGTQWVPKKQEDPGLLARLSRPTGPVDVVCLLYTSPSPRDS